MNTKHTPGPWTAGQFLSKAEDAERPDGMTFLCRVDGIPILVARNTLCNDPMADAKLLAAAPDMRAALNAIHAELDGKEWSSDTANNIANIMRAAGYVIGEPGEE